MSKTHAQTSSSPVGFPGFSALAKVLEDVDRPGSFCTSGQIETPIPDLAVEGVGPLSFPLPPSQAKQLVKVAERAPYGRGGATRVDAGVRRTWQISPDRVRIEDERWAVTLAQIVERAAAGLGAGPGVSAELYKVLLYDKGSFFIEHRDTEKTPGMFATLAVVLPSRFRGGELVVRHAGREARLDLAAEDVSRVSWGAFYADCLHELHPVIEGHRLALIYNLVRRGRGRVPVAPDYSVQTRRAAEILTGWREALEAGVEEDRADDEPKAVPDKLLYVLEHHYTPAGLSFAGLKNGDAAVASTLQAAAAEAGCDLWLAMVSIEESGSAEEDYGYSRHRRWGGGYDDTNFKVMEVFETTRKVEGWIAPDDRAMALRALPFSDEELCPPHALDGEAPDEQHYHEATGNEGASFERTYRRAALVLWPRSRRMAVLAQADLPATVPYLRQRVEAWAASGASRITEAWKEDDALARHILARWPAPPPDSRRPHLPGDEHLGTSMLEALCMHGDADLVALFLSGVIVAGHYDGHENEAIVEARAVVGQESFGPLLVQIVERHMLYRYAACADLLLRLAPRTRTGDAAARKALAPAASAFVARLPGDPASVGDLPAWTRPEAPAAPFVATALNALWKIGDPKLAASAVHRILSLGAAYPPDTVLLSAVTELFREHGEGAIERPGFEQLRRGVADFLEARVAEPLAEPRDWAQTTRLPCRCADCQALAAFMADPVQRSWSFAAAEARRKHLEAEIRSARCDIDCVTERRGSPHTLRCTKNRKSYEQRCAQREGDLAALERLAGMLPPPPQGDPRRALRTRAARG